MTYIILKIKDTIKNKTHENSNLKNKALINEVNRRISKII